MTCRLLIQNLLDFFDKKIPNHLTILAMNNTEKQITKTFDSVEKLFQDLNN